jgi:hypothetical protein
VDGAGKILLQYLQYRLHGAPRGTSHVDDHREPLLPYFITATSTVKQLQSLNYYDLLQVLFTTSKVKRHVTLKTVNRTTWCCGWQSCFRIWDSPASILCS